MFVKFNKSHYLYSTHLSTFFSEKSSVGFTGDPKGATAQKCIRTQVLETTTKTTAHSADIGHYKKV